MQMLTRRQLLRFVEAHLALGEKKPRLSDPRLAGSPAGPAGAGGGRIKREAGALLLRDAPVSLEDAARVLAR